MCKLKSVSKNMLCHYISVSILPQSLSSDVRKTLSKPPWTRTHRQIEEVTYNMHARMHTHTHHIMFTSQKAIEELKVCNDFRDYPLPLQYNLCKIGWYLRY